MKKYFAHALTTVRSDFVKVVSWTAVSTVIKMITGFVSIKVVAKIIGPSGIAMVGQFTNSIALISALATGCIGQGVTKYIAEHYDEPSLQRDVIKNAVIITLVSTLVISLLVIGFSSQLGRYIFGTDEYNILVLLFGASVILYSFNFLFLSIINGFKLFRKLTYINIVSSILALLVTIWLTTQYGVFGALLNCILSQTIIILVTVLFLHKADWFKTIFSQLRSKKEIVRKLGGFTLMSLTSSFLLPLSQVLIRNTIVKDSSFDSAGYWEGINRISSMYLLVVTTSIGVFYLPRLSELKTNELLRHEIRKTFKIVLPPLFLVCTTIFLFRDLIIQLIFTADFKEMRSLFMAQMVGDFFKIASWLLAFLFWAKALTRAFIITEVIFSTVLVFSSFLLIQRFGYAGATYAYAITYFCYFIYTAVLFRKVVL